MLDAFAVVAPLDQVAAEVHARFEGLVDRFSFYAPYKVDAETWKDVLAGFHRTDVLDRSLRASGVVARVGDRRWPRRRAGATVGHRPGSAHGIRRRRSPGGAAAPPPASASRRRAPRPPWPRPAQPPRHRPRRCPASTSMRSRTFPLTCTTIVTVSWRTSSGSAVGPGLEVHRRLPGVAELPELGGHVRAP